MSQDIEVFFPVGVVVGIVFPDTPVWEVFYCSIIETGSKAVRFRLPFAGVAGPTGDGVPAGAVAGGVKVDADEDDVGYGIPGRSRG